MTFTAFYKKNAGLCGKGDGDTLRRRTVGGDDLDRLMKMMNLEENQ